MTFRMTMSLLAGAVAVAAMGPVASAHSIQIFGTPVTSPSGVNTNFAFQTDVTSGNQVNTNDFFVLVDFGGFVSVGTIPANWLVFSTANLAVTPVGTASPGGVNTVVPTVVGGIVTFDSASVADLVFEYTGSSPIVAGGSNFVLGTFNIVSTFPALGPTSTIVGSDHQTATGIAGQNGDPYITPGIAPSVPLPAAAWGGMSLLGALGAGRLVRRRAAR